MSKAEEKGSTILLREVFQKQLITKQWLKFNRINAELGHCKAETKNQAESTML